MDMGTIGRPGKPCSVSCGGLLRPVYYGSADNVYSAGQGRRYMPSTFSSLSFLPIVSLSVRYCYDHRICGRRLRH